MEATRPDLKNSTRFLIKSLFKKKINKKQMHGIGFVVFESVHLVLLSVWFQLVSDY